MYPPAGGERDEHFIKNQYWSWWRQSVQGLAGAIPCRGGKVALKVSSWFSLTAAVYMQRPALSSRVHASFFALRFVRVYVCPFLSVPYTERVLPRQLAALVA